MNQPSEITKTVEQLQKEACTQLQDDGYYRLAMLQLFQAISIDLDRVANFMEELLNTVKEERQK